MNGFKEALEYAVTLSEPHYTEHEGEKYSDKPMHRIHMLAPKAEPIQMNTLTSLTDYIKSNTDKFAQKMILHIKSPTQVSLYSSLDNDRMRETIAEVNALLPDFMFGKFYSSEEFIINVMAKFIGDNENPVDATEQLPWDNKNNISLEEQQDNKNEKQKNDKLIILKYAGTMESGTIADYGDDGISQKATIKQTVTSKEEVIVPNPVTLKPYRTFLEVDQPSSNFIFRVKDSRCDGISAALFESDGGAWKIIAMNRINNYLTEQLENIELPNTEFTVIS